MTPVAIGSPCSRVLVLQPLRVVFNAVDGLFDRLAPALAQAIPVKTHTSLLVFSSVFGVVETVA
jgi:hypothetical protein